MSSAPVLWFTTVSYCLLLLYCVSSVSSAPELWFTTVSYCLLYCVFISVLCSRALVHNYQLLPTITILCLISVLCSRALVHNCQLLPTILSAVSRLNCPVSHSGGHLTTTFYSSPLRLSRNRSCSPLHRLGTDRTENTVHNIVAAVTRDYG
jgi:hypothetical protein